MKGILKAVVLAAGVMGLAVLATSCTAGRDFVRADWEKLNFGVTTPEQVLQEFGKPFLDKSREINNYSVRDIGYGYGSSGWQRGQDFYFFNSRLIGFVFSGDLEGAGINPELFSKISLIQKGVTTRREVEAILGKPCGMLLFPMTKDKAGKTFIYLYTHVSTLVSWDNKIFVINYDSQGIVKDFKYTPDIKHSLRDILL